MRRHPLHATGRLLVLAVCLAALPGRVAAQTAAAATPGLGIASITDDPFAFYYAYYLPNQQLQALRPTPLDSVNNAMVARQYYAQNDRRALYNPISPYSEQAYDPLRPFSPQNAERMARPFHFAQNASNSD